MNKFIIFAFLAAVAPLVMGESRQPNVVIVFTDDQGYQDLGVFGAKGFETPNIDRMAAEGRVFTRWYAAQAVCSASRTAMLTGCYPNRVGIHGALGPRNTHGISGSETTLAEIFKQQGYATAIFGKWHLGHHPEFLPLRHGFDEFFGIPYSNDMWPKHPTAGDRFPPLPLIEGEKTIRIVGEEEQTMMTTRLTERAVDFIHRNKEKPFFLYVPHPQPHVPLYVSDKFRGKTKRGLYGDVISEIDWSVGEILKTIKEDGLDDDTLVIFTSDNGPWLSYGDHGGSALPLREGKGTAWEGGVREPCVMRWPGQIPAGTVCDEPGMNIDILPTLANLIGAELPRHAIDGVDIWPMISDPVGTRNPHKGYWYYYKQNELHAVSMGKWKLYLPHSYRTLKGGSGGKGGTPVKYSQAKTGTELYDLSSDVSESKNIAGKHPEVVKKLQAFAEEARNELGDKLNKRKGRGVREPGRVVVSEKK